MLKSEDRRVGLHHFRIAHTWPPCDVVSIWARDHNHALQEMKRIHGCYGIVVTVDGKYTPRP